MNFVVRSVFGWVVIALTASTVLAQNLPEVEVWKSPNCGCCVKWIEHLRDAGFSVTAHDVGDTSTVRRALGMPDRYGGCHTAKAGGYVIEGHVPASDIKRLLSDRPMARGLAVPGMPIGSPGMEGPGAQPYQTLLIGPGGKARVFAEHGLPE